MSSVKNTEQTAGASTAHVSGCAVMSDHKSHKYHVLSYILQKFLIPRFFPEVCG